MTIKDQPETKIDYASRNRKLEWRLVTVRSKRSMQK